jgi:hypothetical protein
MRFMEGKHKNVWDRNRIRYNCDIGWKIPAPSGDGQWSVMNITYNFMEVAFTLFVG